MSAHLVLDGKIILFTDGQPSFETLQLRLHPAATRVNMLAEQHPVSDRASSRNADYREASTATKPAQCGW